MSRMHADNCEFDEIIDQYGKPVFNYCFHMLRSYCEAQDATQEIFLKAFRHYRSLNRKVAAAAWIYRIAYHHCLNLIRRRKLLEFIALTPDNDGEEPDTQEVYQNSQFSPVIDQALNRLSANERHVLVLRTVEQMEYCEIAAILRKSEPAVRKLFERARRKVEAWLTQRKEALSNGGIAIF